MYLKVAAADSESGLTIYFDDHAFKHMHLTSSETTLLMRQIYRHFLYDSDSASACIHIARVYESDIPPSLRIIYSDGTFVGENTKDIDRVTRFSTSLDQMPVSQFSHGTHSKLLKKTESLITRLAEQLDKKLGFTIMQQRSHSSTSSQSTANLKVANSTTSRGLVNDKVKAAIAVLEAQQQELEATLSETISYLEGSNRSRDKVVAVRRALTQELIHIEQTQERITSNIQEFDQATTAFENETKKLQIKIDELNEPLKKIKRGLIHALYQIAQQAAKKILESGKSDKEKALAIHSFNNKFVGIAEIVTDNSEFKLSTENGAHEKLSEQKIVQLISLFNLVAQNEKNSSFATLAADTLGSAADKVGETTKKLGKALSKTIASVRGQKGPKKPSKIKSEKIAAPSAINFSDPLALTTPDGKAIFVASRENTGTKLDLSTAGSVYLKELLSKRKPLTDTKSKLLSAYNEHMSQKIEGMKQNVAELRKRLLTDRPNLEKAVALHLEIEETISGLMSDLSHSKELKAEFEDSSNLSKRLEALKATVADGELKASIDDLESRLSNARKPNRNISDIHQSLNAYLSKLRKGNFAARYMTEETASASLDQQLEHIRHDRKEIQAQLHAVASYLDEIKFISASINSIFPCLRAKQTLAEALKTCDDNTTKLKNAAGNLTTLKNNMPEKLISLLLPEDMRMDATPAVTVMKDALNEKSELQSRFDAMVKAVIGNPTTQAQAAAITDLTNDMNACTATLQQSSTNALDVTKKLDQACKKLASEQVQIIKLCQLYVSAIQSNLEHWNKQIKLLGGEKTESGVRVPTAIARMTRAINLHPSYATSGNNAYALLLELQKIAKDRIAERGHTSGLFNRRRETTKDFYDQLAKLSLDHIHPSFGDKVKVAEANLKTLFNISDALVAAPASNGK